MPSYVQELHDIGILRSDASTKVGLMLARDPKTNKPIYRTIYDSYFINRAYSGEADYGAVDPQGGIPLVYSDWRRGLGQYIYDSGDTKRYFASYGCDLRFKGQVTAGYLPATVTKPVATDPTIVNADMELTTGWTNGARSATQPHGGTYCWLVSVNNTTVEAYQDLAGYVAGGTYTFTCWTIYLTGSGAHAKIGIDDGVTTTYSSDATGTYSNLSVAKTISVAATRLRIVLHMEATDAGTANFDDASITMTALTNGVSAARADFNDNLYVSFGATLGKLNGSGTAFTAKAVMGAAITRLEVFPHSGGDILLILLGTSNNYCYMDTSEAFLESTATNKTYQFGATVFTSAPTVYANDGANTIRSTTNPKNGGTAWSATQTTVSSSYDAITDMIQKAGALYIMKEDMPYYLNSSGQVQNSLAPECISLTSSTSGKNVVEWLKNLYIPIGAQGLLETDGTTNTWRNPSGDITNASDFVGRVQALAYDESWLFAILDNSTKIEVLAGREETVDGTTDWAWHGSLAEITLAGCQISFVSSVYQKRLWITSTSASDSMYYIPLPTGYGDITSDANRSFATDTYFITPYYHAGFMADNKGWIKVTATLGHTYDANIYWECWYMKMGDSSWTDAGDFKGTSTNRVATLYLPVDSGSNKPITPLMRFKLVAKTNDTTKTPVLLSLVPYAVFYPTTREIIECEVLAGDNVRDRQGSVVDGVDAAYVRTVLTEARDSTWPFSIYDPWGTTVTVRMLPSTPFSELTADQKDENKQEHFYLRLLKVALS